jgi:RNA polymerase sigma-70 factor (ECF subfamily)
VATDISSIDYSALRHDLSRAVARICPDWLAHARDDLVQAAVMRVMQVAEQHARRGEGSTLLTSSYLYKIAYSVLVDEIRRVRRRRESAIETEAMEPMAIDGTDPERVAAAGEIGRGIRECLATLKRERRLAVTLYLQGDQVPGIATVLGWPRKRVENLVYRGLADLRACLLSKGLRP